MPNTLTKAERLSGKVAIGRLMSGGRWGHTAHFKFCYIKSDGPQNRIMVSVPKKSFKRAVKRNLLKRRIRESYRIRKATVPSGSWDILFFYNTAEILPFDAIGSEIAEILGSLK